MTIMDPDSRSDTVSSLHSQTDSGKGRTNSKTSANAAGNHNSTISLDIDSSYEEDLSDTVMTDDSDAEPLDSSPAGERKPRERRSSGRSRPSPRASLNSSSRRESLQRAMSESSIKLRSSSRRRNVSDHATSKKPGSPTEMRNSSRQGRPSMNRAKSEHRLGGRARSRLSESRTEKSPRSSQAMSRRPSASTFNKSMPVCNMDEQHATNTSSGSPAPQKLKDARNRCRTSLDKKDDKLRRLPPRKSFSADQTDTILSARSSHTPRRKSTLDAQGSSLHVRSEHRPRRSYNQEKAKDVPQLRQSNHRRRGSSIDKTSPSPLQTKSEHSVARRRSTIRSNPMSNVLQIQLAQAVTRKDLEDAAMDSSSDSQLSVDIDCEDDEEEQEMTAAEKLLMITQKKRELMMKAKSMAKSTKRVQTTIEDFEEQDVDPEHLNILVEIVQGNNLIVADTTTSDPYVIAKLGDKQIHKTAKIMKTLNPRWTPESRSTFLVSCQRQQLLAYGGMLLKVFDWDMFGGDDPMGDVFVKAEELMKGKGELREYTITPPKEMEGTDAGTLTIRYRRGTRADFESLQNKEKKNLFIPKLPDNIPEKLCILIEIQSARNILIGDTTTSDPYVLVKAGEKNIHKTSKIMKTLNPDWTPELRSTFVLDCEAKDLFGYGGLRFNIIDWDFLSSDDPLGHVFLSAKELCEESIKKEYTITPPEGQAGVNAGTMTIHYRRANEADRILLQDSDMVSWVDLPHA